jgi:hypothetical protein
MRMKESDEGERRWVVENNRGVAYVTVMALRGEANPGSNASHLYRVVALLGINVRHFYRLEPPLSTNVLSPGHVGPRHLYRGAFFSRVWTSPESIRNFRGLECVSRVWEPIWLSGREFISSTFTSALQNLNQTATSMQSCSRERKCSGVTWDCRIYRRDQSYMLCTLIKVFSSD